MANPAGAGLEQALDLSENVLDQAKRDLGNSLCRSDTLLFRDFKAQEKESRKHPGAPLWNQLNGALGKCRDPEESVCKLEWRVGFRDVMSFPFLQAVTQESRPIGMVKDREHQLTAP